ncbi:ribonuclease P protein component [candidate division CPR3 bacterium GWF2_35_18]|uniref:Ribonuclease P protein component n=1 Tax=candidate division CPR3 bacterium GW2011_GWF2_35_18 TaxID=1618350 RepID=A0A0G0BJ90_UNCC3|nr:MAG: Ribonuclease P protein component [candidate division CPR3 bacterium GW2011_GWF2_35_18]KKP85853.1 MAG: Ribonuclease P protein component [candidate division CPR3 bacterium GW2011_GWE2_35_7]OGB63037.1 MAG: ribonuclease P protein component [candidate division CPR3 bacterium GWF2_35_18]OGB63939.1 MAG: ribonuclease P protein component [candidate division CPR3 bacterium RIFOXYA2_FULL_35_13]OGB75755.1 MAG: ribonuclease P protein component [candidate division CPR3 bacterium RIFOXYC2_FULL_35_7]O
MYPYQNRVVSEKDFYFVRNKGKRFHCSFFSIFLIENPSFKINKIGFIVSNKEGKAVFRNRIKRKLRDLFYSWLNIENRFMMVVIGREKCLKASTQDLLMFKDKAEKYFEFKKIKETA